MHVAFGYISHLAVRHGETKQFTGDDSSGQFSLIKKKFLYKHLEILRCLNIPVNERPKKNIRNIIL